VAVLGRKAHLVALAVTRLLMAAAVVEAVTQIEVAVHRPEQLGVLEAGAEAEMLRLKTTQQVTEAPAAVPGNINQERSLQQGQTCMFVLVTEAPAIRTKVITVVLVQLGM
jgi:hypothetical protein